MEPRRGRRAALLMLSGLLMTAPAAATNGYFPHGWGPKSGAMAGAGSALAEDALIAATNPAGIASLKRDEFQIGISLIKPMPGYSASEFAPPQQPLPPDAFPLLPGQRDSNPDVKGDIFVAPQGAVVWRIDEQSAAGVAVYANGGLNETFDAFPNASCPAGTAQTGVYCGGGASSDIAQIFIAPTYARQFGNLRLGASLIAAFEAVEVRGLSTFAPLSSNPERLTNQGHEESFGYGVKLGAQLQLSQGFTAAAVVQSRVQMQKLKAYEGLLANGGDFDVPPYATLGLAWEINPVWAVAFDTQRIWYGSVASLGNDLDSPGLLGEKNGPGFGWDDVTVYKLGLRYSAGPRWSFRGGYSYARPPVDSEQLFFNILAGSVITQHYTLGASHRRDSGNEFDLVVMYAPEKHLSGPNPKYADQTLDISLEGIILDFVWRGFFGAR